MNLENVAFSILFTLSIVSVLWIWFKVDEGWKNKHANLVHNCSLSPGSYHLFSRTVDINP